jgi:hypothetical protein
MKTSNFQKMFLFIAAVGLALSTMTVAAQNSPATIAPPLSYGVPQILQLAQAKVSDDTIIAYIHNSGNSYGLNADQIIYLRQQGVSDNVINFMLNQPKVAATVAQPATQPDNSYAAQPSTTYTQRTTYVPSAPPSTVYVIPNTQAYYNNYYAQPYYYPYYGWSYPAVSLSFGFGGRWGGGFHGGGFHGGGWHR